MSQKIDAILKKDQQLQKSWAYSWLFVTLFSIFFLLNLPGVFIGNAASLIYCMFHLIIILDSIYSLRRIKEMRSAIENNAAIALKRQVPTPIMLKIAYAILPQWMLQ